MYASFNRLGIPKHKDLDLFTLEFLELSAGQKGGVGQKREDLNTAVEEGTTAGSESLIDWEQRGPRSQKEKIDEGIDAEPERRNSKGLINDQLMKGIDSKIGNGIFCSE